MSRKSVSRVGGKAQRAAYRAVAGDLKLAYAQFEELETFARFGARLDDDTRKIIEHGRRIRACLKQPECAPVSVPAQIADPAGADGEAVRRGAARADDGGRAGACARRRRAFRRRCARGSKPRSKLERRGSQGDHRDRAAKRSRRSIQARREPARQRAQPTRLQAGEVVSDTTASLRRTDRQRGDLQSVVRTMKALAASSIGQYERSVRALADYYRTVELGLGACLRHERAGGLDERTKAASPTPAAIGAVVFGSDQGLVGQFNDVVADDAVEGPRRAARQDGPSLGGR